MSIRSPGSPNDTPNVGETGRTRPGSLNHMSEVGKTRAGSIFDALSAFLRRFPWTGQRRMVRYVYNLITVIGFCLAAFVFRFLLFFPSFS